MINGPVVPAPNRPIFGVSQHRSAGQAADTRLCLSPGVRRVSAFNHRGATCRRRLVSTSVSRLRTFALRALPVHDFAVSALSASTNLTRSLKPMLALAFFATRPAASTS